MTRASFATTRLPGPPTDGTGYQAGVCNIGPAEIARRRQAGHVGLVATVVVLALLVAAGAPHTVRLALILPAAVAASGYLQAWLKFCAAFGSRGIFNFGQVGRTEHVPGAEARDRDRTRARQIGLASLAIGVGVTIAAALVPL